MFSHNFIQINWYNEYNSTHYFLMTCQNFRYLGRGVYKTAVKVIATTMINVFSVKRGLKKSASKYLFISQTIRYRRRQIFGYSLQRMNKLLRRLASSSPAFYNTFKFLISSDSFWLKKNYIRIGLQEEFLSNPFIQEISWIGKKRKERI